MLDRAAGGVVFHPATRLGANAVATVLAQDKRPPARRRNNRVVNAVVAALIVAGANLAAYHYDVNLREARRSLPQPVSTKRSVAAAEAAPEALASMPAHIVGPWRCTDQNIGTSTYWEYAGYGVLLYFGDDTHRGDKPIARPGQPVGWALDGNRLTFRYEATPLRSITLDRLSLMELEYRDSKVDEVRCRRP